MRRCFFLWVLCGIYAAGLPLPTYSSLLHPLTTQPSPPQPIIKRSETYNVVDDSQLKLTVSKNIQSNAPQPAIIMVHGGSWVMGQRDGLPEWTKWFVRLGYTVFDIDYRLAPPTTWRAAPGDVKCAIGWIAQHANGFGVDKKSLVLFGNSAGGHLALLAGYSNDTQIPPSCHIAHANVAGIISIAGPTDLTAYYHPAPAWLSNQKNVRVFMGGSPEAYPQRYRTDSPITYARRSVPPTLLVYGTYDRLVPPSQSITLATTLRRMHAPAVEAPLFGVQHGFEGDWNSWGTQKAKESIQRFLVAINP